ncbi:hypothetical protein [Brucella sp. 10RB9210]|uniref:hypothetical protein n=1 Tax=Brucella sp. 10RB9210 TaxID=1844037 RepID=UPI0012AE7625|nr:hypothetical protein [Brucella sp. 10RB9210]MRN79467.1 hypothetical protein [Brucella sp. 10RB9210]
MIRIKIKPVSEYKTRVGRMIAFWFYLPTAFVALTVLSGIAQVYEGFKGARDGAAYARREVPVWRVMKESWRYREDIYAGA